MCKTGVQVWSHAENTGFQCEEYPDEEYKQTASLPNANAWKRILFVMISFTVIVKTDEQTLTKLWLRKCNRVFHKRTKNAKIDIIANFLFISICSFLLYLQHVMQVNIKLDNSGCKRIAFQGCRLHWSSSLPIAQVKWGRQYWHYCIVESLWKP